MCIDSVRAAESQNSNEGGPGDHNIRARVRRQLRRPGLHRHTHPRVCRSTRRHRSRSRAVHTHLGPVAICPVVICSRCWRYRGEGDRREICGPGGDRERDDERTVRRDDSRRGKRRVGHPWLPSSAQKKSGSLLSQHRQPTDLPPCGHDSAARRRLLLCLDTQFAACRSWLISRG